MNPDILLIAAFVAAAVFVVGALWVIAARAPMLDESEDNDGDAYEQALSDADDDRRISEILAASKPMPLEPEQSWPRVRGISS